MNKCIVFYSQGNPYSVTELSEEEIEDKKKYIEFMDYEVVSLKEGERIKQKLKAT